MKKAKKSGGGGANWMDTYADMVTLLMCFFVMMFSMSSVSEEKYQALVESFNPDAVIAGYTDSTDDPGANQGEDAKPTAEQVAADLQELYEQVVEQARASGIEREVNISLGDGYVFISFQDAVFFDGNSAVLRAEGASVLDGIATSIEGVNQSIDVIEVLGHTAQANASTPNEVTADRFLASDRATIITVYLQNKDIIEPSRLISIGYGQWRPVSGNSNEAERQDNRRVELVISGFDPDASAQDELDEYYSMLEEANSEISQDFAQGEAEADSEDEAAVQSEDEITTETEGTQAEPEGEATAETEDEATSEGETQAEPEE